MGKIVFAKKTTHTTRERKRSCHRMPYPSSSTKQKNDSGLIDIGADFWIDNNRSERSIKPFVIGRKLAFAWQ